VRESPNDDPDGVPFALTPKSRVLLQLGSAEPSSMALKDVIVTHKIKEIHQHNSFTPGTAPPNLTIKKKASTSLARATVNRILRAPILS
jgi:hypothetical protein